MILIFPPQAILAFRPSGVGELMSDLSGKSRLLPCQLPDQVSANYAFKLPSRYPVEVKYTAHSAKRVTNTDLCPSSFNPFFHLFSST